MAKSAAVGFSDLVTMYYLERSEHLKSYNSLGTFPNSIDCERKSSDLEASSVAYFNPLYLCSCPNESLGLCFALTGFYLCLQIEAGKLSVYLFLSDFSDFVLTHDEVF